MYNNDHVGTTNAELLDTNESHGGQQNGDTVKILKVQKLKPGYYWKETLKYVTKCWQFITSSASLSPIKSTPSNVSIAELHSLPATES